MSLFDSILDEIAKEDHGKLYRELKYEEQTLVHEKATEQMEGMYT